MFRTILAIGTCLLVNGHTWAVGEFRLERMAAEDWRAEICFTEPVTAYRFERPVAGYRESSWRVADAAFELRFADGAAELWRVDENPYTCGTMLITAWEELPEKNYYAFSSFSDGGVSVYTGYFTGPALRDGKWRETALAAAYLGRQGERVIAREPGKLIEQFVYFGSQEVQETSAVIAVIDSEMPDKAREAILETVPAVNALLEDVFDFRPESPYMIFMATNIEAFDGHSIKGGALDGQIEFNLKGRGVPALIDRNPFHFPKTTAHEVIHLWQRDHWFGSLGNDHPWIHEGSADALAYEVLRKTGIYDEAAYAAAWRGTEETCKEGLQHASVHSGPENGFFDVVYSCGAVINWLVGEMLNAEDPGLGIVQFWQAMADRPAKARKGDSEASFFRTLEELGIEQSRRAALLGFLESSGPDAAGQLANLKQQRGSSEGKGDLRHQ
jgi:hypothetical protein